MSERDYFEQFGGEPDGVICEYCGEFIPEGQHHIVSMKGTEYLGCNLRRSQRPRWEKIFGFDPLKTDEHK